MAHAVGLRTALGMRDNSHTRVHGRCALERMYGVTCFLVRTWECFHPDTVCAGNLAKVVAFKNFLVRV